MESNGCRRREVTKIKEREFETAGFDICKGVLKIYFQASAMQIS